MTIPPFWWILHLVVVMDVICSSHHLSWRGIVFMCRVSLALVRCILGPNNCLWHGIKFCKCSKDKYFPTTIRFVKYFPLIPVLKQLDIFGPCFTLPPYFLNVLGKYRSDIKWHGALGNLRSILLKGAPWVQLWCNSYRHVWAYWHLLYPNFGFLFLFSFNTCYLDLFVILC